MFGESGLKGRRGSALRSRRAPANGASPEFGPHLRLRPPMSKASSEVRLKVTCEIR